MKPLFVTILTGFLGSGKTTLINYLLEHNQNEKIAIVENEFGEINIDGALLKNDADTKIIELSNGCVCCSIRGELTKALGELIADIENGKFSADRLILETTGLADPAPIIQTFFIDEIIREKLVLDAVITLVDAKHIISQLNEHRVAASQIGFADRIILTKVDLIDKKQQAEVLERVKNINQKATIYEAYNGKIQKEAWLGINAFALDDNLEPASGFYKVSPNAQEPTKFVKFSARKINSFSDDVKSLTLKAGELDFEKTDAFFEWLVEAYGNDMLRYKGVLAIKDNDSRLIIQGVHKVVGFDYGVAWNVTEEKKSLMIIIGRFLPVEEITDKFLACEA